MKLALTIIALLALTCCWLSHTHGANLGDADLRTRSLYVQEVQQCIPAVVEKLRTERYPEEAVARAAHQIRRDIGEEYKSLTSAELRLEIRHRNLAKYGDPLGPTVAYLRAKGLSWYEITRGASRTGGADLTGGVCLPCVEVGR